MKAGSQLRTALPAELTAKCANNHVNTLMEYVYIFFGLLVQNVSARTDEMSLLQMHSELGSSFHIDLAAHDEPSISEYCLYKHPGRLWVNSLRILSEGMPQVA